jgi:hypothetical protein
MIKRKRNKSNLINNGVKLTVACKSGGMCIKNPKTMADVNCIGCEKNINFGDQKDFVELEDTKEEGEAGL